MTKDELFLRVMTGVFVIITLYGLVMAVVILWGSEGLAKIMLSAFATMFTAIIGFSTGYLVGKNGTNK